MIDRYTVATWRARLISRHYQAVLETMIIVIVFLLVLLFAGAARAGQAAPSTPPSTAAELKKGQMDMAAMKAACGAKHERVALDVATLRKTIAEAMASADVAVLRGALAATVRHLDEAAATATCEHMKPAAAPEATAPAAADPKPPHAH